MESKRAFRRLIAFCICFASICDKIPVRRCKSHDERKKLWITEKDYFTMLYHAKKRRQSFQRNWKLQDLNEGVDHGTMLRGQKLLHVDEGIRIISYLACKKTILVNSSSYCMNFSGERDVSNRRRNVRLSHNAVWSTFWDSNQLISRLRLHYNYQGLASKTIWIAGITKPGWRPERRLKIAYHVDILSFKVSYTHVLLLSPNLVPTFPRIFWCLKDRIQN